MPKYYKAFRRKGGVLYSAVICDLPGYELVYREGVWNEPIVPGTKLIATTDYVDAEIAGGNEIWEVELFHPEPVSDDIPTWPNWQKVRDYWTGRARVGPEDRPMNDIYYQAIAADAVWLVKRVWCEK